MRILVVMHLPTRIGPPKHIGPWLRSLDADLEVVIPREGTVRAFYSESATITVLPYWRSTIPRGLAAMLAFIPRFVRDVAMFRRHVRWGRPDLVVVVTAMLPTALLGARLGGARTLVYAAEILERSFKEDPGRALFGRLVVLLTKSSSTAIVATSRAVAANTTKPIRA